MSSQQIWAQRLGALRQFASREGHSRVPFKHLETYDGQTYALGPWVGYLRRRYTKGKLSQTRVAEIGGIPGWDWGPFPPGPPPKSSRNTDILRMRAGGASLQAIGDHYGLSRQRVHQIVKRRSDSG